MNLEELCALRYDDLIKELLSMDKKERDELLKYEKLKERLINGDQKHDFYWLAEKTEDDLIINILDGVGYRILNQSKYFETSIKGILTNKYPWVNNLFENDEFCQLVVEKLQENLLVSLNLSTARRLINYIKNNKYDEDKLWLVLEKTEETAILEIIKDEYIPAALLKRLILKFNGNVTSYLLNNDYRITTLDDFKFDELLKLFRKNIHIPRNLIEEPELIKKLSATHDPKDYRFLILELEKNNDVSLIERKRCAYYENEIRSFDQESSMLDRYLNLYNDIVKLIDDENFDFYKVFEIVNQHISSFASVDYNGGLASKIRWVRTKEEIREILIKESQLMITNMIIDYHFKDVYSNVLLDINQLVRFQQTEGRTLSEEEIEIYNKILNLDNLPYNEKLDLFEKLKDDNWVEKFYDHIRIARDKMSFLIKEKMLTSENVVSFKNEALSNENGVDIYVLEEIEFYAFVRSFDARKDQVIHSNFFSRSHTDMSSFSLDGSDKLNTYCNPREYYNFIYENFNPKQVVHMYPVDSYTKNMRYESIFPTDRIFELLTPEEYVRRSGAYSEILYTKKNDDRTDELNSMLDKPKPFALYCYDEITENDIQTAKNLGIGIVLVKTMSYTPYRSEDQMGMYDGENYQTTIDEDANTYLGRRN